jgi:hypothetical protein
MTNHSQGRLAAGITNEIITIDGRASQQHCVGIEGQPQGLIAMLGHVGDELDAISAADARRLAACWNALQAFSTENIERNGIDLVVLEQDRIEARTALAAAKAREAQLVAALQRAIDEAVADDQDEWFANARAALAATGAA